MTLRLESGEKLLFSVDTGCPVTCLDKSLEPKLGKRLSSTLGLWGYYGLAREGVYQAPALCLGSTRLEMSDQVCTVDLRSKSQPGRPLMGILGMDVLNHYCLQLDFEANVIHFFDPGRLDPQGLGKAFPLDPDIPWIHADFLSVKDASVCLDTGDSSDGALTSGLYNRELQKQKPLLHPSPGAPKAQSLVCFPAGNFAGETYTNLFFHKCTPLLSLLGARSIGLQFLARHLVTLNFPERMVYLQRRSVGPLPDELADLRASLGFVNDQPPKDIEARFAALAKQQPGGARFLNASEFLASLKKKGQLPGWLKNETGFAHAPFDSDLLFDWQKAIAPDDYPFAQTLFLTKKGDESSYNYTVVQTSMGAPWQLQRAWKEAPDGRVLKNYPIK
jgi:hypothetical protein